MYIVFFIMNLCQGSYMVSHAYTYIYIYREREDERESVVKTHGRVGEHTC